MKKNFYLIGIIILSALGASWVWKIIEIPLITKYEFGGEYLVKNYHAQNDTIKFFLFILISLLPFLTTYLSFFKKDNHNIKSIIFIEYSDFKKNNNNLNWIYYLFLLGLIMEFFLIDFDWYISPIDIFHEGLWLTSSTNYMLTKDFWVSSYIDRGFFGNFYPAIIWSLTENISIGSVRFSNLILILLNKILLLFLCKQISDNINFTVIKKILFFLLTSLFLLSLTQYDANSYFVKRSSLILLFLNFFLISLNQSNNFNLMNIFLGMLSLISILWFIDIGAYINLIILILLLFFLIRKEFKIVISIFIGIIIPWVIFYFITPLDEIILFYENTINIFSSIDILHGIVHPIPFFSANTRATRTLIYFVLTGVLIIILCFNKKSKISNKIRIFLIFYYILSLIAYKSGLSRSDSGHIKTASGLMISLLGISVIYFFISMLKDKKIDFFFKYFNNKLIKISIFSCVLLAIIINMNIFKIVNIASSPVKIKNLLIAKDESFLKNNQSPYIDLIKYYRELSTSEDCVQIFTDEQALPYLMRKKTCTRYYQMLIASPKKIQNNFIKELKEKKPKFIIYKSEKYSWKKSERRLSAVNNFLDKNYEFHSKFKYWTFLKIKEI